MKITKLVPAAAFAAALCITAAPAQAPAPLSAEAREVEAASQAWMKAAFLERDAKTTERLTAPDFQLIFPVPGRAANRADWVKAISGIQTKWFRHEHVKIVVYGTSFAVVSGTVRIDATMNGRTFSPHVAVTDVWEKRSGQWMIVTRFATHPEDFRPEPATNSSPK